MRWFARESPEDVVAGQRYWEVRVVRNDSSGVACVASENVQSSDVHEVSTTAEAIVFLEGERHRPACRN